MSIFISTGEVSGDIYAAKLCEALHKILPEEEFWGMSGQLARGIRAEWDNAPLHIMGLSKILKSLPDLLRLRRELAKAVISRKPKAVIVIDSPDFHIPLLSKIRSLGYKGSVIYVCPPTIWAWRSGRAKQLKRYCDLTLPLFRFEAEELQRRGVKNYWSGHPLIDQFRGYAPELRTLTRAEKPLIPEQRLPRDPRRVAILPGSRHSEIATLMPILEQAALQLRTMGLHPVYSVAPGLDEESRKLILQSKAAPATIGTTGTALMSQSRLVIGASGTTAVEAMLLDKFMIVVYKGTALEWRIYKMMTNTKLISIPNILAGGIMYPELLQKDLSAERIISETQKYLSDAEYRREIHRRITECKAQLGEPGALDRWAKAIADIIPN